VKKKKKEAKKERDKHKYADQHHENFLGSSKKTKGRLSKDPDCGSV